MNKLAFARGLAILAAGYAALVIVTGAAITPGYSHVNHYISELGATGMPYGTLVSWGGFVPVGILIALFMLAATPLAQVRDESRLGFFLFLGSQAVGYVSAGFAPCDLGCPAEGSFSQALHNAFGLLTYLAAAVGLFLLTRAPILSGMARAGFMLAGIAWLAAFFLMLDPALEPWRGLLQRMAEGMLWLAVLFIAFRMTQHTPQVQSAAA